MARTDNGLRDALSGIEAPGSFAIRREARSSELGLEVKGVGAIPFPISPTKARQLCSVALLARHGFKDQTRLDRRVRDTWEIPKSRIKIEQARWKKALAAELEHIREGLGLPEGCKLRAELHNLLVYAPGQFFVPHQDSEKEDGMIGTLVVTLPSAFSGGTIVVKHHDQCVEYGGAGRNLGLVAFYADCHHEVRPVREGFRIVLTYNLLLSGAGDYSVSASRLDELETRLRAFFEAPRPARWRPAEFEPPLDRLVYLLDHQYSRKSLTWSQLKNADGVRVAALRRVAERLDCDIALALADVHETWSCEDEAYDYRSWRRRRRYDDADDELPHSGDGSAPDLLELQNSEVELRHFVDARGKAGVISGNVPDAELCFTKPSVDLDPFQSVHEGYMGNWGNTVDRWYHRAAVVVWPRERTFIIQAKASATYALDELGKSIRREGLEPARRKAQQLLPFWGQTWHQANDSRLSEKTFRLALELDSQEIALGMVSPLGLEHLGPHVVAVVVSLLESYGSGWFDRVLDQWESRHEYSPEEKRLSWLSSFDKLIDPLMAGGSAAPRRLAKRLVGDQWAWLSARCREASRLPPSSVQKVLVKLEKPLLAVIRSGALVDRALHERMRRFLTSADYPVLALAHLLEAARRTLDDGELEAVGLGVMESHCVVQLEKLLAVPLRSRDDWAIEPPKGCSCALCGELAQFLAARDRTTLEWPLAKDRRAHIHGVLDRNELPVTHATRRSGRPYVLVLAKTQALFEREAAERVAWQRGLDVLRGGKSRAGRRSAQGKSRTASP